MSVATAPRVTIAPADPQGELRTELHHIRDLVFVRDMLRERGATSTELKTYDDVIARARAKLAASAKQASARYATAA